MVEDMPADTADVVDSHKQQVAALTKEVASCRREIGEHDTSRTTD